MIISDAEDVIVKRVRETLGNRVKAIDTLPAGLSGQEFERRLRLVPAVYVAFLGGPRRQASGTTAIDASFAVYAVSNQVDEAQRRRGGGGTIGAYEIMEALLPRLDGLMLPGHGALVLDEFANLYADAIEKMGLTLYSATFKAPIAFDLAATDLSRIGDFITFDGQYDIEPFQAHASPLPAPANTVDAEDKVILPGP